MSKDNQVTISIVVQVCSVCRALQYVYVASVDDYHDKRTRHKVADFEDEMVRTPRICQMCTDATTQAIAAVQADHSKEPVVLARGVCHSMSIVPIIVPAEVVKTLTPGQAFVDVTTWDTIKGVLAKASQRSQDYARSLLLK